MSIVKELRDNADFAHNVTGCSIKTHLNTKAADEIERLQQIIVSVENRLLRGDSDKELIDILSTAWNMPNAEIDT